MSHGAYLCPQVLQQYGGVEHQVYQERLVITHLQAAMVADHHAEFEDLLV
jgi:hypothetical protein